MEMKQKGAQYIKIDYKLVYFLVILFGSLFLFFGSIKSTKAQANCQFVSFSCDVGGHFLGCWVSGSNSCEWGCTLNDINPVWCGTTGGSCPANYVCAQQPY